MKTKWWLAVLWEDQRAVRGGFYPSPHYLCHAYSCNIYNKHLKWNHKAHTRHECSGLLSEKPSENYVFVFKVGPVTRLFRKWRSLKHRLCRETMRLPEHIPDDNNRPSKRWPLAQRLSWVLNTLSSSDLMTQNLSPADKRDLAIVSQNPRGSLEPPGESAKKLSIPACPPMLDNSDFIGLGRGLDISVYLNMGPSPPEHTASWFECTVQSRTSNFTPWNWTSLPMSFILHALPLRVVQMHTQLRVVDDGSPLVPSKNMSWIDQNAITMFQPWLCITITKKTKNGSIYIKK